MTGDTRDPDYVPPVGAQLRAGENRVKLPFWLGSADKYTPAEADALGRWVAENKAAEYMVSDKLDGVSCLLVCRNGRVKLFTRGNGVIGADISYLAKYFNIPDLTGKTISVRGELIMTKQDFAPYHRESGAVRKVLASGSKNYRNARSMVAGLIGAKTARHGLGQIHFVAYEIVGDETMPKPSRAMRKLKRLGFEVVRHILTDDLSVENLSDTYIAMKEESKYEIDGIIVQSNLPYDRNTSGNPSYIFAFKMLQTDNIHTTKVLEVEWNVSKWGQLKPVVIVEPVRLADVTIQRASAHNGKYIVDNGIGPGATIRVTRSKDVIPYIVSIVEPVEPELPEVEWKWDKNNVNMVIVEFDDTMCIKLISGFFAKLGIKHVSQATVKRMYEDGLNSLLKMIGASKQRLARVPRFKEGMVRRTWDNIHNGLQGVKIAMVLGASGIFGNGIGRKRMDMLLLDIPDLLTVYKTISPKALKRRVLAVEGFSDIMANKVVKNVKWADKFICKISKYATFKAEVRVSDTLKGKKFVMSGFRDKGLENDVTERGGKTVGSVSKNTSGLIVLSKGGKATGKIAKAQKLGIPIYEKDEFIQKFIR
jgi:NAD-dependent DNA ligase